MRRLIINADDLGLTSGVNRAIIEGHTHGVITSATLMAGGAAVSDALSALEKAPGLSVGCHAVLVDGSPTLPSGQVLSLTSASGGNAFPATLGAFLPRALAGRFAEEEIEAEATAQFRKLQALGLRITHFDTHKHIHVFPVIARPLLRAAKACGIGAVRNPFVPAKALAFDDLRRRPYLWQRYWEVGALRRFMPKFLEMTSEEGLSTPDGSIGVMETGFLDAELFDAMLRGLAENLPEGTWEMVCHPGYSDDALNQVRTRLKASRQKELGVLTSSEARQALEKYGITLISYHELVTAKSS